MSRAKDRHAGNPPERAKARCVGFAVNHANHWQLHLSSWQRTDTRVLQAHRHHASSADLKVREVPWRGRSGWSNLSSSCATLSHGGQTANRHSSSRRNLLRPPQVGHPLSPLHHRVSMAACISASGARRPCSRHLLSPLCHQMSVAACNCMEPGRTLSDACPTHNA